VDVVEVLVAPAVAGSAVAGRVTGTAGSVLLGRMPRGVRCHGHAVAATTALLWVLIAVGRWLDWWPWRWVPALLALSVCGVLLGVADLVARRLPDVLTLSAYPLLAGVAVLAEPQAWGRSLAAGAVVLAAHGALYLCDAGIGLGDVKLVGALGFVLGARGWPQVLLLAPLAAVVTLLVALRAPPGGRLRTAVPHGPGLLTATWILVAV
jgi:leader peptidase (prepilin peptidase)/N-methyltransferase